MSVQCALPLAALKPPRIIASKTHVAQKRLTTSERAAMLDEGERRVAAASVAIAHIGEVR